ncbi:MAG: nitroreductase family protein [Desulfobacteraceae bacterium]|nr:MAG: nitroreductase family protein [Desulfobacteraceae bacterium]
MTVKEIVLKNRSYRRFYQDTTIDINTLKELLELSRFSASGGNIQPLKYILSSESEKNALIFRNLAWAAYLKNWAGPAEGERPAAYIIVMGDKKIKDSFGHDPGIAVQSMLLGAVEKGLGGCIIGSINKDSLRKDLNIPDQYEILLVIALGKPKESVVIEQLGPKGDIKYWRDDKGIHHVPKRSLEELIVG